MIATSLNSRTTTLSFIVLLLLSCGHLCRAQENTLPRVGIPVVSNGDESVHDGQLFRFEQDLVIGGQEDGPEWQLFTRLGPVIVGPEGRMIVLHGMNQLLIISSQGELIRTIGGKGQGPGEFELIWGLYWIEYGAEFWVNDAQLFRMSRFTADGDLIDTIHYGEIVGNLPVIMHIGNRRFLGIESEMQEDYSNLWVFKVLDQHLKPVEVLAKIPWQGHVRLANKPGVGMTVPFKYSPRAVIFPSGGFCILNPDEGGLLRYDESAKPLYWIERSWDRARVSSADREYWRQRNIGMPSPGGAFTRGDLDAVPLPRNHAPFINAITDDEGRLWVRRTFPPRTRPDEVRTTIVFDVFDDAGLWLGVQHIESDFGIPSCIRDGYAYISWNDRAGEIASRLIRYKVIPLHK